jgi:addiction module HigA family antidote
MTYKKKLLSPIHPGEILCEEYLQPLGLSGNKLALDLRVPVTRISAIAHKSRGITTDTALRLARTLIFQLVTGYDLDVAQDELAD